MESEKVSVVSPFIEKLFGYIAAGLLLLAGAGILLNIIFHAPGCVWLTIIGFPSGFAMFVLIYLLPGKCWTDSEGVVLAMPFQGQRTIPYKDITGAYISLRPGVKPNNYLEKRQLIHTMHIVTKTKDIQFSTTSGTIGSPMLLAEEYARAAAVAESPFAEIVNTVKIQCRSNPEFDDIDW